MVRAKFVVKSITKEKHWDAAKEPISTIKLQPVTSGSDENKSFYAATPSGEIVLSTLNAQAGNQF